MNAPLEELGKSIDKHINYNQQPMISSYHCKFNVGFM